MRRLGRILLGVGVCLVLMQALTFFVLPKLLASRYAGSGEENIRGNFPVMMVIRDNPTSADYKIWVVRWRDLREVTRKHVHHSFLLPIASGRTMDDPDDQATFTAVDIAPGRQRIEVNASLRDYIYQSRYEAEDKRVFPRYVESTGPDTMFGALAVSAVLTLVLFRLWARLRRPPHSLAPA